MLNWSILPIMIWQMLCSKKLLTIHFQNLKTLRLCLPLPAERHSDVWGNLRVSVSSRSKCPALLGLGHVLASALTLIRCHFLCLLSDPQTLAGLLPCAPQPHSPSPQDQHQRPGVYTQVRTVHTWQQHGDGILVNCVHSQYQHPQTKDHARSGWQAGHIHRNMVQ